MCDGSVDVDEENEKFAMLKDEVLDLGITVDVRFVFENILSIVFIN